MCRAVCGYDPTKNCSFALKIKSVLPIFECVNFIISFHKMFLETPVKLVWTGAMGATRCDDVL